MLRKLNADAPEPEVHGCVTTVPFGVTVRHCPALLASATIARLVVVALVVVELVKSALVKCEVDDAKIPPCAEIGVEVAEVLPPKLLSGINGNAAETWPGVA